MGRCESANWAKKLFELAEQANKISKKNQKHIQLFGPLTLISTHVVFVYKKARLCKKHQINQTIDISCQRERYPSQQFQKQQVLKIFPRNTHKYPPTHPILSTGAGVFWNPTKKHRKTPPRFTQKKTTKPDRCQPCPCPRDNWAFFRTRKRPLRSLWRWGSRIFGWWSKSFGRFAGND